MPRQSGTISGSTIGGKLQFPGSAFQVVGTLIVISFKSVWLMCGGGCGFSGGGGGGVVVAVLLLLFFVVVFCVFWLCLSVFFVCLFVGFFCVCFFVCLFVFCCFFLFVFFLGGVVCFVF